MQNEQLLHLDSFDAADCMPMSMSMSAGAAGAPALLSAGATAGRWTGAMAAAGYDGQISAPMNASTNEAHIISSQQVYCVYTASRKECDLFYYTWQMSSDFANFQQKHTPRNLKQKHVCTAHHISFYMFELAKSSFTS